MISRTDPFDFSRRPATDPSESSATPVAELMAGRNAVHAQNPGELVWNPVRPGASLLDRQSVMTLEDSRAEIAFLDGAGLIVESNSLVQIMRPPGNPRIVVSLLRGTLQKRPMRSDAAAGPPVVIQAGNSEIHSKPDAEITIAMTPETIGGARLSVYQGEAAIHSANGSPITANAGNLVEIPAPGETTAPIAQKSPFTLRKPRGGDLLKPSPELAFEWSIDVRQIGDSPQEIEVSTDPDFIRDVRRKMINATYPPLENARASFFLPPADGATRWYWRVRALSKQIASPVEHFLLQPDPRPAALIPTHGSVVRAGFPIDFAWGGVEGAETYEIQIAPEGTSSEGKQAKQTQTTRKFARIHDLPLGQWQWQVRARFRGGVAGRWSDVRRFSVMPPPPPPPKFQEPEIQKGPPSGSTTPWLKRIWRAWVVLPSAFADEAPTTNIKLRWEPVPGASSYRLQIARQNGFGAMIVDETVKEPLYLWAYRRGMENSKGRVFYRVATVGPDGAPGAFSAAQPFMIPDDVRGVTAQRKHKPVVTPAVVAAPAPAPTPETPAPAPAAPQASSTTTIPRHPHRLLLGADILYRGIKQTTTDPALRSVRVAPFLSQRVSFASQYRDWAVHASVAAASYEKPASLSQLAQPELNGFTLDGVVLRSAKITGERQWFLGGSLGWRSRWIKTSAQSVGMRGGAGLGPAIAVMRNYSGVERPELGAILEIPVTGFAGSGFAGAVLSAWRELNVLKVDHTLISIRVLAEASSLRWSAPSGTWVQGWALSIGPVVRHTLRR